MTDPELVTYITEQTQEGISAQVLREALMERGWHERDIENAMHDVAAGLHPATPGASIHADLAQVRGMVAHLAGRVKTLEARLASIGALPMQRELPAAHYHHPWVRRFASLFIAIGVFVGLGILAAWSTLAPTDQATIALGAGIVLLLAGYVSLRHGWAWAFSSLSYSAIAIFALVTWRAYHLYAAMEWFTALGLAVLGLVLLSVMERWVTRMVHRA